MKRKMFRLCAVTLLALPLLVTGCDTPAPEDGAAAPDKPRVALVMKSLANEFFKTMEDGARAYHQSVESEFELLANGIKNEEDVGGQVNLVEQMITQQAKAIVIAPADSKAMVPVLKKAVDAGIVVVNIDNKLDDAVLAEQGLTIPFVGPDNRQGARLAGEYLTSKLEKGAQVALIGGIPSAFNAIQRRLGFEDAMKAAGIEIVASQAGNWEMAKANQIAAGIVTEHPELDAILCANDNMALGAVAALREAGKLGEIQVVGYDNISAVQDLVRDGKVLCTVDQHADQLAVFGIQYALEMIGGGGTPQDRETPVNLITAEVLRQQSAQ